MRIFKLKLTTVLLLLLFPVAGLFSQTLHPSKIMKPIHFDVSKKLRDVKPIPPGVRERSWKNNLIKNHLGMPDEFKNEPPLNGPDPVLQNQMLRGSRSEPTINLSFPGVSNLNGVAPPDTDGDVGLDHYFQMINLSFAIWDKDGNQVMEPADNQTLWEGFDDGQPFDNANDGDPIVLYDEYADRWLASQFAINTNNDKYYELVAISATSDPTGEWYRYAFEFDNMPDYPKFGIWPDGYYFSVNQFRNAQNWAGAGVCIVDRDAMLNGDPDATLIFFDLGTNYGSLLPADADGSLEPPEGSPNYFMNMGSNKLRIWEVSVDWDNTVNSTVTLTDQLTTEPFSTSNVTVSQPGTGQKLGTLAGRLMYRLQYRNFGDYEVMLTNHTVNAGGGRAGVRWYELRNTGDGWSIYQQGTYAPDDGDSRWMASVAMNDNGDIAVGYSVSGPSTYPSIRVAGQTTGAPLGLGILDIDETSIYEGNKSQTGVGRWGDYSMMSVDPSDGQTFWFTTEYSNGGWSWKTQIASISFAAQPVADFEAYETIIPTGGTADFTDMTEGIPDHWEWYFEGAVPDTSSEKNPQNIEYDTEGTYTVQLIASNLLGSDTIIKENYITVSSTILPDIDFSADKNYDCLGDTVAFTDHTKYSPIKWEWSFDPSTVTFVNGTSDTSQNPQVIFDAAGAYNVSLTAWNLNGPSTLTKEGIVNPGGHQPYYKETFEDNDFSMAGWTVENPDDDITWEMFETGGTAPGNISAGIDFSDYYTIGARDRLISPPFNLEGMSSAALELQYAYAKRYEQLTDSLIIYVSGDCGQQWTKVYAGGEDGSGNFATHELLDGFYPEVTSDWCMAGWGATCIGVDLTPWAGQANVRFAFESYSAYGNPMMIDNIQVSQYVGQEETPIGEDEVLVFPNPASNEFEIRFGQPFDELIITNQLGQVVHQEKLSGQQGSVKVKVGSHWTPGIYFLRMTGKDAMVTKKVMINK